MVKFAINGKTLDKLPVVQDGKGTYYWNGSSYFKPVLKDFDNAKLPSGFKKYTDGSHKAYSYQNAIDFSASGGLPITADRPVKITYKASDKGGYCVVEAEGVRHFLTHIDYDSVPAVGTTVKAGNTICKILKMEGSHLHYFAKQGDKYLNVKDIILRYNTDMEDWKKKYEEEKAKYEKTRKALLIESARRVVGEHAMVALTNFAKKIGIVVKGHYRLDGEKWDASFAPRVIAQIDAKLAEVNKDANDSAIEVVKLTGQLGAVQGELDEVKQYSVELASENESLKEQNTSLQLKVSSQADELNRNMETIKALKAGADLSKFDVIELIGAILAKFGFTRSQ